MSGLVKWFSFDNANAPQLSNTWGCMIDVLDACLVTGFGSQPVSSIVVEDGVAIATFEGVHNLKQFQVIEITGANEAALNGEFKILGLTANTIEFLVDLPDQVATGTISCKLAPLGWDKVFAASQKAVYQAKDKVANPYFLRVDNSRDPIYTDSYAKFAKVGLLDACTGVDDLTGNQAPFDPLNPNKNWIGTGGGTTAIVGWFKWYYAFDERVGSQTGMYERYTPSEGNRAWILVGNKDTFYIVPNTAASNPEANPMLYGFGCVESKSHSTLPFLSASDRNNTVGGGMVMSSALGNLASLAMIKNDNDSLQNSTFGTVKLPFSIQYSGNTNYFNRKNDEILLGPFYMIDNLNNLVGEFPMLLASVFSLTTTPSKSPFNHLGKALMKVAFRPTQGVFGSFVFNLGDYV